MKPARPLLVLPTVLAALAVGLLVWLRTPGGSRDDVELVDSRGRLEELLAARASAGGGEGAGAAAALVREPLTEEQAAAFFPGLRSGGRDLFDPLTYYRQKPDLDLKRRLKEHPLGKWRVTTNAQGFRNARDLLPEKPDLRVLVTGDSHVDGVVPMDELATTVLEALLAADEPGRSVEVLNAARGGYSFFNYLGVIEKYVELEPDVFVVVFYGGNDFAESLPLYKYYRHLALDPGLEGWGRLLGRALEVSNAGVAQCVHQEAHFARVPEDFDLALEGAVAAMRELVRVCRAHDVRPIVVHLPPADEAQPWIVADEIDALAEVFGMSADDLAINARLARGLADALRADGVEVLELGPVYAAQDEPCYWRTDHHIDTRGHALLARELQRAIDGPR